MEFRLCNRVWIVAMLLIVTCYLFAEKMIRIQPWVYPGPILKEKIVVVADKLEDKSKEEIGSRETTKIIEVPPRQVNTILNETDPKDATIVITVLTGSSVADMRMPVMYRSFASFGPDIDPKASVTVVMFNDKPLDPNVYKSVPGVSFILVTECNDGQTGGLCCKTAASYKWVLENMKNVKWVFRATDDTFVHIPNLIDFTSVLDPFMLHYIGEQYIRPPNFNYADGGAGWLISRKLLERIQGEISTTLHNSPGCYDDVAFGNYMISIGVSLRQGPFHNEDFAYILPDKIEERNEKTDLQLKVYHNFHQQHKGFPAFKPISFHMRFGSQAGAPGESKSTEKTFTDLKIVIDYINKKLKRMDLP